MKFKNGDELYDELMSGTDLYNQETCTYVFMYNDETPSICHYYIEPDQAEKLRQMSVEYGEYWAAFLGAGGWIVDGEENIREWCRDCYEGKWQDVSYPYKY